MEYCCLNDIKFSNPWTWDGLPFKSSLILILFCHFQSISFITFIKFIIKYFILFDVITNETVFLIHFQIVHFRYTKIQMIFVYSTYILRLCSTHSLALTLCVLSNFVCIRAHHLQTEIVFLFPFQSGCLSFPCLTVQYF